MQKLNVDNRDYSHAYSYNEIRMEYPIISKWIEPNSKVIDLGCGDGALLQSLKQKKNISEVGLDVSEKAIELCRQKNVNAFCAEFVFHIIRADLHTNKKIKHKTSMLETNVYMGFLKSKAFSFDNKNILFWTACSQLSIASLFLLTPFAL